MMPYAHDVANAAMAAERGQHREAVEFAEAHRAPEPYDHINPSHYKSASGLEVIDVVEAFLMDKPYRWAPLKYLLRAGRKPGQDEAQELRKAVWWIEREIRLIETGTAKPAPVVGVNESGYRYRY